MSTAPSTPGDRAFAQSRAFIHLCTSPTSTFYSLTPCMSMVTNEAWADNLGCARGSLSPRLIL